MSAGVIRLPKRAPLLGYRQDTLRQAIIRVRAAISSSNHDYICCAASGLYTWALREWLQEILRDCGIRTDGAGFDCAHAPDWLIEHHHRHGLKGDRIRRLYFLDCVIEALK